MDNDKATACSQAASNATAQVQAILDENKLGCQLLGGAFQATAIQVSVLEDYNTVTKICLKDAKANYLCCIPGN
jgi:hypothetical protein